MSTGVVVAPVTPPSPDFCHIEVAGVPWCQIPADPEMMLAATFAWLEAVKSGSPDFLPVCSHPSPHRAAGFVALLREAGFEEVEIVQGSCPVWARDWISLDD